LAFGVVGGAFGEVGLLVILVAFGLADGEGDGQGQAAEEVFEIGRILSGGVDADMEARLGMLLVELLQAFVQSQVAGSAFEHSHGFGSNLAIGAEEGDAMAVACGVDADADTVEQSGARHKELLASKEGRRLGGTVSQCVARKSVSLLRYIFGQAILVISGQGRMMYQNLTPKPEGTIFSKRSKPQGSARAPHDATTIMTGG